MIGHPTVGWLLERIWYVVSGQERRDLIAEMKALTVKTNALLARIAREEAEQARRDIPPWERKGTTPCKHGTLTCPVCHGWGLKPATGGRVS